MEVSIAHILPKKQTQLDGKGDMLAPCTIYLLYDIKRKASDSGSGDEEDEEELDTEEEEEDEAEDSDDSEQEEDEEGSALSNNGKPSKKLKSAEEEDNDIAEIFTDLLSLIVLNKREKEVQKEAQAALALEQAAKEIMQAQR